MTRQRACRTEASSACLARSPTGPHRAGAVPKVVHDVLQSTGEPLDSAARGFFEARFGHDFGSVRVHADAKAAESAERVGAYAYTVGRHIAFARGQYAPASEAGRRLLAHELGHTLQQREGGSPQGFSAPHDRTEREADSLAERVMSSGSAAPALDPAFRGVRGGAPPHVARKQAAWPAWHQEVLNDIAAFAGPSDGKPADEHWPELAKLLCGLSAARAKSLNDRLTWDSPGMLGGTDDFALYVRAKFPEKYWNAITVLSEIAFGSKPRDCKTPEDLAKEEAEQKQDDANRKAREAEELRLRLEKKHERENQRQDKAVKESAQGKYEHSSSCSEEFLKAWLWPGNDIARGAAHYATSAMAHRGKGVEIYAPIYFGKDWANYQDLIVQNLNIIRLGFEQGGYDFKCEKKCDDGVSAYINVLALGHTIHVCQDAIMEKTVSGVGETILHEMARSYAGADAAMGPYGTYDCNSSDTKDAINSPACLAHFANEVFGK